MPNFIEIEETFVDGRMYARTDGRTSETGFIRSTLSKSRPNKEGRQVNKQADVMIVNNRRLTVDEVGAAWRGTRTTAEVAAANSVPDNLSEHRVSRSSVDHEPAPTHVVHHAVLASLT